MKTANVTYLIFLLALLSACTFENEENVPQAGDTIAAELSPDWLPPQVPGFWLDYKPTNEDITAVATVSETVPKPIIVARRDTINGIRVRTPDMIILPEEHIVLTLDDSIPAVYYAISYVSTNSYLGVNFDNDIFSNTDYYYTNGIKFELVAPIFASSPFAWPMLPYHKSSMNYHGMVVVQNMYTPTNPDTIHVLDNDRPFAAYLYLGHTKNTLSKEKKYRQYSEIVLGLIGPGSLGGFVQGQIHNIEPVGWQNQIQNDLVLNYSAVVEKGIYNPRYFDLNIYADGQIGTLYDNIGAGVRVRAGKLNPYFSMPNLSLSGSAEARDALNLQYGIFGGARMRLIVYDATLQGGFFNANNNYTIPAGEMERLVLQASAGIYFAFGQLGLTYEHFYNSPKFKNARHHQWGHINITYCF